MDKVTGSFIPNPNLMCERMGFIVWREAGEVWREKFGVWSLEFGVWSLGFRVLSSKLSGAKSCLCRVWGD